MRPLHTISSEHARLRRCLGLLSACLLAAVSASASGQRTEIRRPSAGQVLRAGEWAEVSWTALPPGVEEFELLLSLDDGASYTVRLTPQLDPATDGYRWRVPNFPTSRARIQLRVGIDNEEIALPAGEAFEIVGEAAQPVSGLRWHDGEWWSSSTTWPVPPLERLPVQLDVPVSAVGVVIGALSAHEQNAALDAAWQTFERSSPPRRTVRASPPVTDHSPLVTPARE